MKLILFLLLPVFFVATGFSQYPKYLVRFTDKNNTPYSLTQPSQYLSQASIARRIRYHISLDSTDLPVNPDYVDSVLSKGNVQFLSASKWLNQILIYCTDIQTISKIQTLPFVSLVEGIGNKPVADSPYHPFKEKIQPLPPSVNKAEGGADVFSYGNSYDQIHIHLGEFLHDKGYTGKGITIAMLDAGFNNYTGIPALDSVVQHNQILGVRDYVAYDNSVTEDDIHGMYCLSTIAADLPGQMVGSAPKANFWLIRTENTASEYPIEEHNWVVGAEFADSAGADMISSSLGYSQFDDPAFNHTYADFYQNSTIVSKGAAFACRKGMIVTNSAGNEGNSPWTYIIFPADADSVCTVAAVDKTGQIAYFSSYGYPGKIKPDIASVGLNTVIASASGPVMGSGTSFSNPNIAGLIACLWQAFPAYNNMTILQAVYQSSDRYLNPDDRYGYGIPNMKIAYHILKKKQNIDLYGSDWLFAEPDPFTTQIDTRLIGQVDGNATVELTDADGNIIAVNNLITEQDEVYTYSFTQLGYLPEGNYEIVYLDSLQRRSIQVRKETGLLLKDWLQANPVPFHNSLNVYLKAPESGRIALVLLDAGGKKIETKEMQITENTFYTIQFLTIPDLPGGVYFIRYIGPSKVKTLKVVRQ